MDILLPDLGEGFSIKELNTGNHYSGVVSGTLLRVMPGTYLLSSRASGGKAPVGDKVGELGMNDFIAPKPYSKEPFVRHTPYNEVSGGRSFTIRSVIVGLDSGDKAMVQISRAGGCGPGRMIPMMRGGAGGDGATGGDVYIAEVPAEIVMPGLLQYRIILERAGDRDLVFPGDHSGDPFAWDYYDGEDGDRWQTFVAAPHAGLEIFDANKDRDATTYSASRRGFAEWVSGADPGRLLLKLSSGVECFVGDKIRGRESEEFGRVVIRGKGAGDGGATSAGGAGGRKVFILNTFVRGKLKITFINGQGDSWSAFAQLPDSLGDVEVPFSQLASDDAGFLLLPRPYPGFLPLRFKYSGAQGSFSWKDTEKIQITMEEGGGFELESVELRP
jgi:hypothetical protein